VKKLIREPLLHFVLLGVLLFVVDHGLALQRGDAHRITLGAEVDAQVREIFRSAQQRDPSAAELEVLRQRWIDNEVLYREGLALGVDQGDDTIRERVIFKALNVVQANLSPPPPDEAVLRAWFERHHAQYDEPARLDFLEAVVVGSNKDDGTRDDGNEASLQAFVAALNGNTAQGSTSSSLRVFKGRPRSNIVESFGADFTQALEAMPVGVWRVLPSKDGVRVVRLEARVDGVPARFEAVQPRLRQDWLDDQMQQLRTAAVRELAKKYKIELVGARS
jgi:hypothetical protein